MGASTQQIEQARFCDVDLATGASAPVVSTIELWWDEPARRLSTV